MPTAIDLLRPVQIRASDNFWINLEPAVCFVGILRPPITMKRSHTGELRLAAPEIARGPASTLVYLGRPQLCRSGNRRTL